MDEKAQEGIKNHVVKVVMVKMVIFVSEPGHLLTIINNILFIYSGGF